MPQPSIWLHTFRSTSDPHASKQSSASAASGAKSLWAMKAGRLNLRMALLTSQNDMYTIGRGSGEMLGGDACTLQPGESQRAFETKPLARIDRGLEARNERRGREGV